MDGPGDDPDQRTGDGLRRAVLFDSYPHVFGGAQRTNHLLARSLPGRGWRLLTMVPADGPFPERLRADALPVQIVPAPAALTRYGRTTTGLRALGAAFRLPGYWMRMARALRQERPSVVHVVDHRGLLLAGLPARLTGGRLVWHVQAMDRGRFLNWVGARLAHCIVVPTTTVLVKMPDLRRSTDGRAVANVVPDHARRDSPVPRASGSRIVTTARLHPDKGLDLLIDALALVRAEVPDAVVQIIGGPQDGFESMPRELLAHAEQRGVDGAVELLGFVDSPHLVVADGACYVQPARERTEILPLAILEAMATGTPVVATDVGGVRDIVRHDQTGLLVPPEDPEALAAALVRILTDAGDAERLRNAAFALAGEDRFTVAGLLDGITGAYEAKPVG